MILQMDISNSILGVDNFSERPLEYLVSSDKFCNVIETRLEDPNQRNHMGYTLLHVAARSRKDNPSVVQLLIARGADVNAITPFGHTPLHFAVCSRKYDVVEVLIEAGASINSTDFLKRTALHFATSGLWRHPPIPVVNVRYDMWIIETLFRSPEIDLNPVDVMGETPLMWAVKQRHYNVVRALLDKGADPNIPNNKNRTPLHEALSVRTSFNVIAFKLLAKGAGIYCVDESGQAPVDILLVNIHNADALLFAEKCVRVIVLRYEIRESLKRKLEKFPVLFKLLRRCSREVRRMKKQVIYDNVTLHDIACGCFQSEDPMKDIYKPVSDILISRSYAEYHNLIFSGMSNQEFRRLLATGSPELRRVI